jgi:hypothetical protein
MIVVMSRHFSVKDVSSMTSSVSNLSTISNEV